MSTYIARRLLLMVPAPVGISLAVFVLLRFIPGDVVDVLVGSELTLSPEARTTLRKLLGLDAPIHVQYALWVWDLLRGDLGSSLRSGQPVLQLILLRLPITAELALLSLTLSVVLAIPLGVLSAVRRNSWLDFVARLLGLIGLLGAAIILLVALLAIVAPVLAPFDPIDQIARQLEPPSARHLLGADEYGRDVLSRLVFGSRISLHVGVIAVAIALAAGASVGVVAGYYGGTVDNLVMRLVDSLFAFPSLLLAIAITGILGPGLTHAMIAIGIVSAPTYARLARGTVLSVAARDYVEAARTLGAGDWTIISRHILPNVLAPLIVQTSLSLSGAILAEASLSFLGLGTQPPDPSWGTMLGTGRRYMETAPWVAVFPGVAITITVLGFNLLGDGLRDALDPRLRGL